MKRSYSKAQVGQLLRRATEFQEEGGDEGEELSLEEIGQIALEMGIAPKYVERAATEAGRQEDNGPGPSLFARLVGGPFIASATGLIDGDSEDKVWEAMILELRRESGVPGSTSELGQSRSWSSVAGWNDKPTQTDATLVRGENSLEVRLDHRHPLMTLGYAPAIAAGFFVTAFVVFGLFGADSGAPLAAAVGALGGAAVYRSFLRRWTNKKKLRLEAMVRRFQRIGGMVPEPTAAPVAVGIQAEATPAGKAPLLDLEQVDSAPDVSQDASGASTRKPIR